MTGYDNSILLEPSAGNEQPRPLLNVVVSCSNDGSELIGGRAKRGATGSLSEICLRVAESVFGYTASGKTLLYSELSRSNAQMRSKHREFNTTGTLIRIDEPWFAGPGEHQVSARRNLAGALAASLMRDRAISPGDVSYAYTGLALYGPGGARKLQDAIAVFDDIQGGLRLTGPLFDDLGAHIERLHRAHDALGPRSSLSKVVIEQFEAWYRSLGDAPMLAESAAIELGPDERIVFTDGSRVQVRIGGVLQDRHLLGRQLAPLGDTEQLLYQYESHPGVRAWVPHEMVEPFGDDWQQVIWNPQTNAQREICHVG